MSDKKNQNDNRSLLYKKVLLEGSLVLKGCDVSMDYQTRDYGPKRGELSLDLDVTLIHSPDLEGILRGQTRVVIYADFSDSDVFTSHISYSEGDHTLRYDDENGLVLCNLFSSIDDYFYICEAIYVKTKIN